MLTNKMFRQVSDELKSKYSLEVSACGHHVVSKNFDTDGGVLLTDVSMSPRRDASNNLHFVEGIG